jgi:phenylpyruvate tautomerase PptA (4-oxalocrotonate tautomerase family)
MQLVEAIHACIVDAFQYPPDKKIYRFFPMEDDDFIYTIDRSDRYTLIEISIFEGRSDEAKKKLIRLLFDRIHHEVGIAPNDVEITIFETPKSSWGIRGVPGDELHVGYKIDV